MGIVKGPKRKQNYIHERFVTDPYLRRKRLILDILHPDVWSRVVHPVSVQELENHRLGSWMKNFLQKKGFFIQFKHVTFKCKLVRPVLENSQEDEANVAVTATDAIGVREFVHSVKQWDNRIVEDHGEGTGKKD
jgi:hypothetical protein